MEVRKGYKQTEVGVIPEDWDVTTLGEIFEFKNGLNKEKKYFGQGTPIVNYMDVYKNNGIYSKDIQGRVTLSNQEIKNYEVKKGDVFFTRTSETVEEVGITTVILDEVKDTVFSGFVLRARHKDKRMFSEFEKYCYGTPQIRKDITSKSSYTTRALTNGRSLSTVKIPVPPLAEQEAIAEALSDADALIESLETLLTKKRQVKQGAMSELLSGKRRVVESGEWKETLLSGLGSTFGGLTGKTKSDFGNGTSQYITFMNIMSNVVIDSKIFERVNIKPSESQNRVRKGDLFFNGSSETPEEVGMCAVLTEDVKDVFLNSFCFGYRFREGVEVNGLYFAYFFRSHEGRELMKSLAQGATRYNLSKTALLRLKFPLPDLHEQTAIAEILSDMDTEIRAVEEKLSKARAVKAGMMSALLTGRVRLV